MTATTITIGLPVEKKIYSCPPIKKRYDSFEVFYHNYLKHNGCTNYYPIANKYSSVDYFLTSAFTSTNKEEKETTIVIEYKKRPIHVYDYATQIIEKYKFEKLITIAEDLDCVGWYLVEYDDAVIGWQLNKYSNVKFDTMPMPDSTVNYNTDVFKDIYHLDFKDANFVVGKRQMKKTTADGLVYYINQKRNAV